MSADTIIHSDYALAQVGQQYTESVRFLSTVKMLADMCQNIEDALIQVRDITDLDSARGAQLDVIGSIVGVSRSVPQSFLFFFFGFADTPGGQVFGEEGNPSIGARMYEEGEPYAATTLLSDPEYRLMIYARIIRNHTIANPDDIITAMQFMFSGAVITFDDLGGMRIRLGIGRVLTYTEKVILQSLDLLPRPSGVLIDSISTFDPINVFGFADTPNAKGFADEPDGGGVLSEEF